MSYTRSFEDFAPPKRFDNQPFTTARIQEAAAADGPYTTIQSIALSPLDTDPANPRSRNFTTDNATLAFGWYRIEWVDASGAIFDAGVLYFPAPPPWMPSVDDVASNLRARTKTDAGVEVGTFTADTRPTAEQVESLIDQATKAVSARVGSDLHSSLTGRARELAAIYAAMLVELSYWPEQIGAERSPYPELKALFDEGMSSLIESQLNATPGTRGFASVAMHPDVPSYLIPPLI